MDIMTSIFIWYEAQIEEKDVFRKQPFLLTSGQCSSPSHLPSACISLDLILIASFFSVVRVGTSVSGLGGGVMMTG